MVSALEVTVRWESQGIMVFSRLGCAEALDNIGHQEDARISLYIRFYLIPKCYIVVLLNDLHNVLVQYI